MQIEKDATHGKFTVCERSFHRDLPSLCFIRSVRSPYLHNCSRALHSLREKASSFPLIRKNHEQKKNTAQLCFSPINPVQSISNENVTVERLSLSTRGLAVEKKK